MQRPRVPHDACVPAGHSWLCNAQLALSGARRVWFDRARFAVAALRPLPNAKGKDSRAG